MKTFPTLLVYQNIFDMKLNLKIVLFQVVGQHYSRNASWTPQQDLEGEDDISSDEDPNNNTNEKSSMPTKFSVRTHVFSLSLPRDNQLAAYMEEKARLASPPSYINLQRLKRSMSGVLGNLAGRAKDTSPPVQSDNWFLSRSAPNSLGAGPTSLEAGPEVDVTATAAAASRVMYLPDERSTPMRLERAESREDVASTNGLPQDLQDAPPARPTLNSSSMPVTRCSISKTRRFTFQSTVRQIERRRLAERLSREAERRERQRLSELAAMQRVEEEFQRKRAREKATIRQQLRLFWMEEPWDGVPAVRPEPDGAVSSPGSSPTAELTQVLSEYRQPRREYREYRPVVGAASNDHSMPSHGTTVHPKVVCDMPRATAAPSQGHASNYRRNFARGLVPPARTPPDTCPS